MRKFLVISIIFCSVAYTQSRNEEVRKLNRIINFMDESSRVNRSLFWDVEQFASGFIHSSQKNNNNYWYTHSRPDFRVGPFDNDKGKYPELKVDEEGMVIDFEYVLYPYLVAREEMDTLMVTNFFEDKPALKSTLISFRLMMDSLVIHHRRLYNYVNTKEYLNDAEFKTAQWIIHETEVILDNYRSSATTLYTTIEELYDLKYKPYSTKKLIRDAATELRKTVDLMRQWENDLWLGNSDKTPDYDRTLHALNDEAMTKDSIYLSTTYGFKVSNNGAMPHTRYCTFYSMMKSTLYWYAKDKRNYPKNILKRDVDYNEYVQRTHMVVEDYNDFLECSDGKQLASNMHYSMKQAGQIGVDTAQNVLLNFPRWGYLYHFVAPDEQVVKDSVVTEHQQLILNASPHHMVFLLDASASMHEPGKLDLLKEGAKYLVSLQRKSDHISLLSFSTHSHILMSYVTCDQKSKINLTLDKLEAKGATNANEGIAKAFGVIDSNQTNGESKKIILVTDGKFQLSGPTLKLISSFKKKGIELCILWIGEKEDPILEKDFKKLSAKGNGRYYRVTEANLYNVLVVEASE